MASCVSGVPRLETGVPVIISVWPVIRLRKILKTESKTEKTVEFVRREKSLTAREIFLSKTMDSLAPL